MAAYTVKRTCGHLTTEQLYGANSERERRISWLRTQSCLPCSRSAATAAVTTAAAEAGLPELTGTPKQIEWAARIRSEKLVEVATARQQFASRAASDQVEAFDGCVARLSQQASAGWWIDRRNAIARDLLRQYAPVAN